MGGLLVAESERRRLRADEVIRMVELGLFDADDHIELVNGELLVVPPQGPLHRAIKDELARRLTLAYAASAVHVLNQGPVVAGPEGLPEPDLAVVRGGEREYLHRHPAGADLVLVIELAHTSQARDRAKAADYARAGVPIYWLVDLAARRLDLYEEPLPESHRYRKTTSLAEDDEVALPELEERWSVKTMLP